MQRLVASLMNQCPNWSYEIRSHCLCTARQTTSYCVPSRSELITNMLNCLVHHLISTKLRCTLLKCTSVQNYIVYLDLHVRCKPQNTILYASGLLTNIGPLCATWCTMQVAGAQRRFVVHHVVLYC